jgi:hypothetical protein
MLFFTVALFLYYLISLVNGGLFKSSLIKSGELKIKLENKQITKKEHDEESFKTVKAKINGIEVEGSPEEILKFKQLSDEKSLTEKQKTAVNPNINPFGTKVIDCVSKEWVGTGQNPYDVKFDSEKYSKTFENIKVDNK